MYKLIVKSEVLANSDGLINVLIDDIFKLFDLSTNNANVIAVRNEINVVTMRATDTFTIAIDIPVTKGKETELLYLLNDKYECQWVRDSKGFNMAMDMGVRY